jgi:hypothetical protein
MRIEKFSVEYNYQRLCFISLKPSFTYKLGLRLGLKLNTLTYFLPLLDYVGLGLSGFREIQDGIC